MGRVGIWILVMTLILGTEIRAGKGGGKGGGGSGDPPDPAIAYTEGEGGAVNRILSVMNADGSNATSLLQANNVQRASWSSDGQALAFYSDVQGPGIYILGIDGTGLTKVLATSGAPAGVAWSPAPSPDGYYKISFGQDGDLYVVNLDGSGLRNLTGPLGLEGSGGTWSPDARRIAVGNSVFDLGVVQGELAIVGATALDHGLVGVTHLCWARTGDRIALAGRTSATAYDLWIIDLADPSSPTNITNTPGQEERFPSWSPDDTKIVFWANNTRGKGGIFTMPSDGSGSATRISATGFAPSWRRDP